MQREELLLLIIVLLTSLLATQLASARDSPESSESSSSEEDSSEENHGYRSDLKVGDWPWMNDGENLKRSFFRWLMVNLDDSDDATEHVIVKREAQRSESESSEESSESRSSTSSSDEDSSEESFPCRESNSKSDCFQWKNNGMKQYFFFWLMDDWSDDTTDDSADDDFVSIAKRDVSNVEQAEVVEDSNFLDAMCRQVQLLGTSLTKHRGWSRRLARLSAVEARQLVQDVEQHVAEKTACCAHAGDDRNACFERLHRQKFASICRGDRQLPWHRHASQPALKTRCCALTDSAAVVSCFENGIRTMRISWQETQDNTERFQPQLRHRHRMRPKGNLTGCCEAGERLARFSQQAEVAACSAAASTHQPRTHGEADAEGMDMNLCRVTFSRCCRRELGGMNRGGGQHHHHGGHRHGRRHRRRHHRRQPETGNQRLPIVS